MGENKNNSWFKYLESVKEASPNSEKPEEKPEENCIVKLLKKNLCPPIGIYLINYECTLCMKIILELRIGMHFHGFCAKCVPRINCISTCQSKLIHSSAESQEYQDKVIEEFRALGGCVIKYVVTHKRKNTEDEILE